MATIVGLVVFELLLAPICVGLIRVANGWGEERRGDVVLALGAVGLLFFIFGVSVVLVPPVASPWQVILVPPVVAAMGTEIALGFIALNLLLLDHVTGRAEMALRTMFGGGSEEIQKRIPLYSLRTPIHVLRSSKPR